MPYFCRCSYFCWSYGLIESYGIPELGSVASKGLLATSKHEDFADGRKGRPSICLSEVREWCIIIGQCWQVPYVVRLCCSDRIMWKLKQVMKCLNHPQWVLKSCIDLPSLWWVKVCKWKMPENLYAYHRWYYGLLVCKRVMPIFLYFCLLKEHYGKEAFLSVSHRNFFHNFLLEGCLFHHLMDTFSVSFW